MFGSTVLELAFGLIFTFLVISLIASSMTEALASALSWRANTLLEGVKDLLNDQQFSGLALSIYNHGLVNARASGAADSEAQLTSKPSYIEPKQFASALIDVTGLSSGGTVQALQARINTAIKNPQLNTMLNGMVERAGGDVNRIRDDIASWFDNGMDRVAGDYKRRTQFWSFVIGLSLAIALNVDALKVTEALWEQPMIIKGLSPPTAGQTAQQALEQLQNLRLPFGWDKNAMNYFLTGSNWIYAIVGWLISGIATLFGAPFWFDTLQKFVQLRGAGSK